MPRHGNTRRTDKRSNGHRMHRRSRLARLKANAGKGRRTGMTWGRGNP